MALRLDKKTLPITLEIMRNSDAGCDVAVSGRIGKTLNKLRKFKPFCCAKGIGQNVKGRACEECIRSFMAHDDESLKILKLEILEMRKLRIM